MKTFWEVLLGLKSLFTGLSITIREFFKPTITTHYPRQTETIPARFRGHIQLTQNPDGGTSLCIACKSCERACPSACIIVEGVKKTDGPGKTVSEFRLDFGTCSVCGLCIEACPVKPVKAIEFTKRYNLASTTNDYADMDLVQRYKDLQAKKS